MKFKINEIEWEIIEEAADHTRVTCGDKNRIATCHFREKQIYINKDLIPIQKRLTLKHELSHAFLISIWSYKEKLSDEELCDFVALYSEQIIKIVNDYFA